MPLTITKPTVGGSNNTWGTELNTALDAIKAFVDPFEVRAPTPVLPTYGAAGSYTPAFRSPSTGPAAVGGFTDTIQAYPICFAENLTIDRVAFEVTTFAASATVDIAVYDNDPGRHRARTRLATLATAVAASSNGVKETVTSFTFQAGVVYWIAYNIHGAGFSATCFTNTDQYPRLVVSQSEALNMTSRYAAEGPLGGTPGTPPATFPGTSYGGANMAIIFRRT